VHFGFSRLDKLGHNFSSHVHQLDRFKEGISRHTEEQIRISHDDFHFRLEDFKKAFIEAIRGVRGRLDNAELHIIGMVAKLSHIDTQVVHIPTQESDVDQLSRNMTIDLSGEPATLPKANKASGESARSESRLIRLENKLSGLIAKTDDQAIRFAGLMGFTSMSKSNTWLETEMRRHPSGLIVDVHMVFEHIHNSFEGIDTIATMEKLYKIKVSCIANSVAMTSFDAKVPKFFCKVQGHKVLKGDASYFDRIPTHADSGRCGNLFQDATRPGSSLGIRSGSRYFHSPIRG
jgi:hypothetical protein